MAVSRLDVGVASRTAWYMGLARAAHQIYDQPLVLDDPLAMRIIGPEGRRRVRDKDAGFLRPDRRRIRSAIVSRSRFAEDLMAAASARGVEQFVILGAGLDTFACRAPFDGRALIVEVDHPATQQWKHELLAASEIEVPGNVRFEGVDLSRAALRDSLVHSSIDFSRPVSVSWLGVTYYLAQDTVEATLATLGSAASGSEVVFDYFVSPSLLTAIECAEMAPFAQAAASTGESWRAHFDPARLPVRLRALGFGEVNIHGREGIAAKLGLADLASYRQVGFVHARVT